MKKIISFVLVAIMCLSLLAGCKQPEPAQPNADLAGTYKIKVWVAENVQTFTETKIKEFQDANPQFAGYAVTVEQVGEGDAASNMITDVAGGADIYGFAQDQLARLVSASALSKIDIGRDVSLKVIYKDGSRELSDVSFSLYFWTASSLEAQKLLRCVIIPPHLW